MKKEFDLSDLSYEKLAKRYIFACRKNKELENWKKEFIRLLKEELCECKILGQGIKCSRCRIIDKLSGFKDA